MNKAYIFLSAFLLTVSYSLKAQTDFSLSGLGRVIVTDNKLDGNLVKGSTVPNRGMSGYILFDLKPTLKVNNNLHANAILRVKNPFGTFFGDRVTFEFRQFQIMGKINKLIDYQIGDINVEMTPYTVYAFPEMYNQFESEILRMRRNVVNYENFVIGNAWRLQGVQGFANLPFQKGIQKIYINSFAVRTNATNDAGVPDRVLLGTRAIVKQSDVFSIGGNYVGMEDVRVSNANVNYVNHVLTGDIGLTANTDALLFKLRGETGFSSYKYSNLLYSDSIPGDTMKVSYNDYFYDVNGSLTLKSAKIRLFAGYRNVGPQFSSPSAQTRRINITTTPLLFPVVPGGARQQTLFDRFTQENIYNRSISPVLYPYLPQYENILPYGDATPNRKGLTAGIATDTSAKVITGEVRVDMFSEIIGEGVTDLRKFTGVRGGVIFDISEALDIKRKISVTAGARYQKTTRGGGAAVDFKSNLIDLGASVEVAKRFDLLAGTKILMAKGTEYLSQRNIYNLFQSYSVYTVDLTQAIYSIGARVRFSEGSYFTVNYNISQDKSKINSNQNYNIRQVFFNYTLIIP